MSDTDYDDFSDPASLIERDRQATNMQAINSLGDDPEKAARAVQLGQATGDHPALIYSNLENYEQQHKAALTSSLIQSSKYLRQFIEADPMNSKIASDSYPQLDESAEKIENFLKPAPFTDFLKRVTKEYTEGVGEQPLGASAFRTQADIDYAITHPFFGSVAGALASAVELMSRPAAGVLNVIASETGVRDFAAMAEWSMMRGDVGIKKGGGVAGAGVVNTALLKQIQEAMPIVAHHLSAGEIPPKGISPIIDRIHEEQERYDAKTLKEAEAAADAVPMKERTPETMAEFTRIVGERSFGISAEAIDRLYGDEVPHPEDGKLGMVPGLADKLAAARDTGTDVQIPTAEWLAHVDPELRDELRDDIRYRPEQETKVEKEAKAEAKEKAKAAGVEIAGPKEVIAEDLPVVRAGAGLEPSFANGDRKLELKSRPHDPKKDFTSLTQDGKELVPDHYNLHDENGKPVAYIDAIALEGGKKLWIDNTGMIDTRGVNSLGPALTRDIARQLKEQYPDAEQIGGYRISGARGNMGEPRIVWTKFADLFEPEVNRQIHDLFNPPQEFDLGHSKLRYSAELTPHQAEADALIRQTLARIAPGAKVFTPNEIGIDRPGFARRGFHQAFREQNPWIVIGLDMPSEALGFAKHEAMHFLKQFGFFKEGEWDSLVRAAREQNWIKKYDIDGRYPDLSNSLKLEEAIAEGYRTWTKSDADAGAIHPIFERIKQLFEQLKDGLREILGREPKWEDVFERIDTGEVGAREPKGHERGARLDAAMADDFKTVNMRRAANDNVPELNLKPLKEMLSESFKEGVTEPHEAFIKKYDELHTAGEEMSKKGNWTELNVARYNKLGRELAELNEGEWTDVPFEDFKPSFADIEKPMAERPAFGPGAIVNKERMANYMKLIAERHQADLVKSEKSALAEQTRRQSAEWKANRVELRKQVAADIGNRPDVAADNLFSLGELYGTKVARVKLDADRLTEEQKASLPRGYYGKDGLNPDDVANLFGYDTGDRMVNRLAAYADVKKASGKDTREFVKSITETETDRQMEMKYGKLAENVLADAHEQAVSENQLSILHEETQLLAEATGKQYTLTKGDVKQMALEHFSKMPMGEVKGTDFLKASGRMGEKVQMALETGNYAEALRHKQQQTYTNIYAAEAFKVEKAKKALDKTAKTFRKRDVKTIEPEYQNHIQDVLQRIGYPMLRSVEHIEENIQGKAAKTVKDFVEQKLVESMGLRDMPLADVLVDPNFEKPLDQLTVGEFKEVKNTVDALVANGRNERKVNLEGEERDRQDVLNQMKDQVKTFPKQEVPSGYQPGLTKRYIAGSTAMPTLMRRFDRGDPKGIFDRVVTYPMAAADNYAAKLARDTTKLLREVWKPKEMDFDKRVDSPFDEANWKYSNFTRENVLGLLQNAGNRSNWKVTAKGWGADPKVLMDWLVDNTKPEDWERAQALGDKVFNDLIDKADTEYEKANGFTIDKIPLEPIDNKHGTFKGWYHPLIPDPVWEGKAKVKGGAYEDGDFGHASTSNGYTKSRSGAIYPVDLSFRQVPKRINQMIQDIAFRNTILDVQKIFNDPGLSNTITEHYGKEYSGKFLMDYLRSIAGNEGIPSELWQQVGKWSEYLRQNTIGTYIGLNPYTVAKHAPTAFVMSLRDVGPTELAGAYKKLYGGSSSIRDMWSDFAMDTSEELQRRERNWQDTMGGTLKETYGEPTTRERVLQWGSWPVAKSDMFSAKALWLARFDKSLSEGSSFGEAVDLADDSVRRQHGSTARTNQPELVRGGGPLHGWLTSVYGFFGTVMQRRIELMHSLNDMYQLGKEGEIKDAAAKLPGFFADVLTYYVAPIAIEEWVTGMTTDDKRGWGTHILMAGAQGIASSMLYFRDIIHAFTTGQDPGVGLLSSPLHDLTKAFNDAKPSKMFSKERAGKTIQDFLTIAGEGTGMVPKEISSLARAGIDLSTGVAKPKSMADWRQLLTKGTTERRVER